MTDDISEQEENIIEGSQELAEVAVNFVDQVDNGTHKPKKAFDEFKRVIEKYEIIIL